MIMTPQDSRRFTEKPDFITTPGYLKGGSSRYDAGLPRDSGPYRVITNMAVMGFEPETKWMQVLSINPGYNRQDVQENCGFELKWASEIEETSPPTETELRILREEVDPQHLIIGRK
jgi:glutaconate CoA-transferase subunit B